MSNEIKINSKTYILKSIAENTLSTSKKEIAALKAQLKNNTEEHINNKYKKKYEELYQKYRSLYMQYKSNSSRSGLNRQKYINIIHKLQMEIIDQTKIEDIIKETERMSKIEQIL